MTLPGLVAANNLSDVVDRERAWDNLGSSVSTNISIPSPSLDLNFASNKSLIDDISGNNLITFTRDTTGTFVGSNGLLQTAASGVPRFDHNPATGESLGLLVEEARTNLIANSEFTPVQNILRFTATYITGVTRPDGSVGYVLELTTTSTSPSDACFVRFTNNPAVGVPNTPYGGSLWLSSSSTSGNIYLKVNDSAGLSPGGTLCNVTSAFARFTVVNTAASNFSFVDLTAFGYPVGTKFYVWGTQLEAGPSVTSYIPTSGSQVTRAADVASITGANFSSWYNQAGGTVFAEYAVVPSGPLSQVFAFRENSFALRHSATTVGFVELDFAVGLGTVGGFGLSKNKFAGRFRAGDYTRTINGGAITTNTYAGAPNSIAATTYLSLGTGASPDLGGPGSVVRINAPIARFTYWTIGLSNLALQYITSASGSASSTTYPYTFTIKGKDTLALNSVSNASTRDFVFIKGLSTSAQSRLTTAAQQVASGTVFQDAAMLKASPTTSGNYLFSSGITLSGVSTRINGTPALSIATSPFSGSTATASILLRELQPQTNWRITEPMPSGTIASPEFAIPFETNDFVLFMKAGQN